MKKNIFLILSLMALLVLSACGPKAVEGPSDAQIASGTATAEVMQAGLPEDLPIPDGAFNMKMAANNTYISFEVLGPIDVVSAYYKEALIAESWEKINNSNEEPMGGAVTLLRSKPKKNVSITIQSIPESENVRVLITVIGK